MALSSVFFRLALVIAPAASVVRRTGVGSGAWSQTARSNTGLSFWRALRKELEAKKQNLVVVESSLLSSAARRDLLWQAVREVDDKFHKRYMCALEEGTSYDNKAMFLTGQAAYSKANIASGRECALMCAADSLADRGHTDLACKSFAYNKTAQVCKFFNFVHHYQNSLVKDECCSTGAPCNLDSMRDEIQTHFQVELKRTMLNAPSQHVVVPKAEAKASTKSWHPRPQTQDVARKVEQKAVAPEIVVKAAPSTKHVAPKVEEKAAAPKVEQKATLPKVEQKVVPQTKQAAREVEVKAAPLTTQVAPKAPRQAPTPKVEQKAAKPKIEQKVAPHVPKVELSVPSHPEQVAPKAEQKAAAPAEQLPPIAHVAPAASTVKHTHKHHQVHWRRILRRWRHVIISTSVGVLLVATFALAWRFRSAKVAGGSLKHLGA